MPTQPFSLNQQIPEHNSGVTEIESKGHGLDSELNQSYPIKDLMIYFSNLNLAFNTSLLKYLLKEILKEPN